MTYDGGFLATPFFLGLGAGGSAGAGVGSAGGGEARFGVAVDSCFGGIGDGEAVILSLVGFLGVAFLELLDAVLTGVDVRGVDAFEDECFGVEIEEKLRWRPRRVPY